MDFNSIVADLVQSIANLARRVTRVETREQILKAWTAPTLINSWANSGGAYAVAGYWKDPWGIVHLRGRVTGGAFPSDAFVLPADYRPQYTQTFAVPGTTAATVDVEADGSVRAISGTGFVSLDAITFRAYA